MDKPFITENAMDMVKLGISTGAPVTHVVFGLPLQDWMYVASIMASIFFILDKLPGVIRRINEWITRKRDSNSGSSCPVDGESP